MSAWGLSAAVRRLKRRAARLVLLTLLLAWLVSTLGRDVFVLDIGKRLTVLSDLNFAIDRAFREAGIDIPFPQRDVHIIRHAPPATGSGGITSQGRT